MIPLVLVLIGCGPSPDSDSTPRRSSTSTSTTTTAAGSASPSTGTTTPTGSTTTATGSPGTTTTGLLQPPMPCNPATLTGWTDTQICTTAPICGPFFLDQWQTPSDDLVWICHADPGPVWHFVELIVFDECLMEHLNHPNDIRPSTICDS